MTLHTRRGRTFQLRDPVKDIMGYRRRFPYDADRATTTVAASSAPTVTLPAHDSGDYLLVHWRAGGTLATPGNLPTGWSTAVTNSTLDGSDDVQGAMYKQSDGTEGTSLTFASMGTSRNWAVIAWRITGAGAPSFTSIASTGASTVIGGNFPSGLATDNYLFIHLAGCEDAFTAIGACPPLINIATQATVATGATGCSVFGASCRYRGTGFPGAWNWFATQLNGNSNNKMQAGAAFPPS